MKWRKIFVISIIVICIVSINLAVYIQITQKEKKSIKKSDIEPVVVDTVELTENFEHIFDNKIDYQNNDISSTTKIDTSKELIYTIQTKQEKQDGKYDINVNIPYINISNSNIENINKEIITLFYNKVNEIMSMIDEKETIYSVKYKAYVNDNILSLVINSTLKEGENSQRTIIKTYNYNLTSNEVLDINRILNYRALESKAVQNKINSTIKDAAQTATQYQEIGYSKYLRNVDDAMYKVENTNVFFLGEGKALYIIYPYGNSNYTTELDLLVL